MTHVLIVGEKKSMVQQTIQFLVSNNIIPRNATVDTAYTMPMSWWRWKIDRRIPLKSLPFTDDPERLDDFPFAEPMNLACFDQPAISPLRGTSERDTKVLMGRFARRFDDYDQVIVFPDSDINGVGSALRWFRQLDEARTRIGLTGSVFDANRTIPFLWLRGLSEDFFLESWENRMPIYTPRLLEMSRYFEAKYRFDYWWNSNGLPLFTETLKRAGCQHHQSLSKYELLTLHALARYGEPVGLELFREMQYWRGTGRYPKQSPLPSRAITLDHLAMVVCKSKPSANMESGSGEYDWCGIGTAMSRASIIEGLADKGLVKADKEGSQHGSLYEVSEAGHRFLSYCHKDTFDPDLPFRLHDWCRHEDFESMRAYIRRFFGKQKRFLSKCTSQVN